VREHFPAHFAQDDKPLNKGFAEFQGAPGNSRRAGQLTAYETRTSSLQFTSRSGGCA
jgi:hypothetical protein